MEKIGLLASFATAVCWTLGAIAFEKGIKRIGVLSVNFFKVLTAIFLLTLATTLSRGMPLPLDAPFRSVIYLSLSGIVGFVFADMFLFSAYGTVGPRIAMLFMALCPPISAGMGYLFIGESLDSRSALGMGLVLIGIFMTIFGRQGSISFSNISKEDRKGYIFASIAPFCQSGGLVLTKIGLGDYNPISGAQIRVFMAIIGFGLVSLVYSGGKNLTKAAKDLQGLKYTAIGAFFGPFVGVSLSLFALQRVSTGIVSTLIGLTPIMILVPDILVYKKKIKPLEIAGAFIAVIGTAVFFLW